jgi:small subunit ribosomal protein S17
MPKRVLQGVVVSTKCDKTITVKVERRFQHPKYGKFIKTTKKYHAHDEKNTCVEGQEVAIEECAPISKTKKWIVLDNKA